MGNIMVSVAISGTWSSGFASAQGVCLYFVKKITRKIIFRVYIINCQKGKGGLFTSNFYGKYIVSGGN